MPDFDGRGPRNNKPGRGRGSCGTGGSNNGRSLLSILWDIGKFLVTSGIAGATYKKITSNKNNPKIETDKNKKIDNPKKDSSNIIDADWEKINK